MTTAIYARVSSAQQDTASQERDLKAWASIQAEPATWYKDKATGTNMDRPGMQRLLADIRTGKVTKVVVWRLDRLGRTAKGLLELMDELTAVGCGFLSLKDAIDLSTASGRLLLTVLAGVAQFETEVRSERQRAGIEAAREAGKTWGGRKAGTRVTVTEEKEEAVKAMHGANKPIAEIARVTGLSRQTCYKVLGLWSRKAEAVA
jgi:DNA invertase Pin-like site-specific DNA recombinase